MWALAPEVALVCATWLVAAPFAMAQALPPESPPVEATEGTGPRSMDELLQEAVPEKVAPILRPKTEDSPNKPATLPRMPEKDAVQTAVKVLMPAIRGCAMGGRGRVDLLVRVRSDGQVLEARVAGPPFAGTASGRCMEGALRKAKFPPFTAAQMRLRIPFLIR